MFFIRILAGEYVSKNKKKKDLVILCSRLKASSDTILVQWLPIERYLYSTSIYQVMGHCY